MKFVELKLRNGSTALVDPNSVTSITPEPYKDGDSSEHCQVTIAGSEGLTIGEPLRKVAEVVEAGIQYSGHDFSVELCARQTRIDALKRTLKLLYDCVDPSGVSLRFRSEEDGAMFHSVMSLSKIELAK
jgi:hypothetical protein